MYMYTGYGYQLIDSIIFTVILMNRSKIFFSIPQMKRYELDDGSILFSNKENKEKKRKMFRIFWKVFILYILC